MSLEANKAIVRHVIEALTQHNLSALDVLLSPVFVLHTYQIHGLDAFKDYYARLYPGFPD